ncbi:hypothetical protein D9757_004985 [Collybiopsis confluens]|uniref:Uncharacterized protein n=1 Tax=Collybiopsis confluens TaxID=2823264 RepID=A0A8H5MCS3_9AGAR|nr:hypothetical protein D9757_004985 [Collybiopsis confluens]
MLQPLEGFDDLGLTFKFEYPNYYCETLLWNNGSFLPATSSQTVHHLSQIPLTEGSILDISPQHIAESSKPKQDISFMNHPAHLGAWKYSNPSLDASFVEGYLFPGIYEEAVDRSPATLFSTPSTPALSLSDSRSSSSSPYIHSSENTVFDREHKGYISQPESGDLTLFLHHHYDGPVATTAPPAQMAELDSPFAIHSPGVHSIPSLRLESSTSPLLLLLALLLLATHRHHHHHHLRDLTRSLPLDTYALHLSLSAQKTSR